MAERRAGPFPVHEDFVTADDGTNWLFLEDCPGEQPVTGRWELVGEGLSLEASATAAAHERDVRARLLLALQVWELAAASCSFVRVHAEHCLANDPLPTFVEILARAALTDGIGETCDGGRLGLLPHSLKQIEGLLSPSSYRRVLGMLQRHMATVRARR